MRQRSVDAVVNSASAACRADMYAAQTTLCDANGERYTFWGLFCHNDLARGEFIGLYNGEWTHELNTVSTPYALQLSIGAVVTPVVHRGQVSPAQYPVAMANEPRPRAVGNAALHEWSLPRKAVSGIPDSVDDAEFYCAGLVACKDIPRDTEVRWHYGKDYGAWRDYAAGCGCVGSVARVGHPVDSLRHLIPYDAVTPFLDTPCVSSDEEADEAADPSYTPRVGSRTR